MDIHTASDQQRRNLLKAMAIGIVSPGMPTARAQASRLRIGQSIALTGPLSELGVAMHQGGMACFRAVNAAGGVQGQEIELVAKDDAYDTARAVENVSSFLGDDSIFGLFNCMGTPMLVATLPQIRKSGIPYFTPYSGALQARPGDMRNVFNVRASYPEEAEQLVKHLHTIGLRKIAVVHQNNSFGKEIFDGAKRALAERSLSSAVVATIENDASNAKSAVDVIVQAMPEAVIVALAGKPAVEFVRGVRKVQKGIALYATSVLGAASALKALGEDAVGLTVTQVVPLPSNTRLGIVRDFLRDWKALGTMLEPSHVALEGYINARVFVEVLRRCGRRPSRAAFIDSTWGLRNVDLGGYWINARGPGTNASQFVELTMIARDGRFIR